MSANKLVRLPACLAVLLFVASCSVAAPASAFTLYAIGGNFGPSGGQTGLYTVNAGGRRVAAGLYFTTLRVGGASAGRASVMLAR